MSNTKPDEYHHTLEGKADPVRTMKYAGEIVKLKSDDPCPCGSTKKFRDCCEDEGDYCGYSKFEGPKFAFDQDEMNERIDRILRYTYENIVTFWNNRRRIDRDRGLETLRTIHNMADKILEPFLRNSSCQSGCNYCCYLLVRITSIEAELIRTYIQENFDHSYMSEVRAKIDDAKKHFPDPVEIGSEYPKRILDSYFNLQIPCPFLSDKGLCVVYEVRPLVARTHIVFSDPDLCKTREPVAMYEADYLPQMFAAIAILSRLVFDNIDYEKHVAHWFVDEFRF